jgi:3-hydroxy-9,10-secoandrosta-1,3,5(10)-triene-9,17-dione monooxygenase reductase component
VADRDRIAPALGKIASGLYIATARVGGEPVGMLCSFVEQAAFEPPAISIALAPERPITAALDGDGVFALHVLSRHNHALVKSFARGGTPEAFAAHEMTENPWGVPLFAEAWAFLVCKVLNKMPAGDHTLYLAEVLDGALQKEEHDEPMVRVRRNGFGY